MLSLSVILNPSRSVDFENLTISAKKKLLVEARSTIPKWFKGQLPTDGTMNRLSKLPLSLSLTPKDHLLPATWTYLQLVCILFPDRLEKIEPIIRNLIHDRNRPDIENRSFLGCSCDCFECDLRFFNYHSKQLI